MPKRKTKKVTKPKHKRKLDLEKIVFASTLALIGFFVLSFFCAMLFENSSLKINNSSLSTQMIQGDNYETTAIQTSNKGAAESLIIVGAISFCILGCVIFAGIKIHERFF